MKAMVSLLKEAYSRRMPRKVQCWGVVGTPPLMGNVFPTIKQASAEKRHKPSISPHMPISSYLRK